jgi:asparagine synthase (glutamine-hydrolysing)
LLQHPAIDRRPNEGFIAEQLSGAGQSLEETPYKNIFQLPRAHSLIVGPNRFRKQRYWDLEGVRRIHYTSDEDYSDHFVDIFREAVRCRLRSHRLISAELSGGLDSSSVVSMASSLSGSSALEAVSMVFPGQPCDETQFIQEVIGRFRVPWNPVSDVTAEPSEYADRTHRYQDYAETPGLLMFNDQMALAQRKGARVVLTGQGGDDFLTGGFQYMAKLVREFRWADAYRRGRADSQIIASQTYRRPSAGVAIIQNGIWPFLPELAKNAIRAALGRKPKERFPWISPAFAKKTDLIGRLEEQARPSEDSVLLRYREDALGGLEWPFYWMLDRYSAGYGLEYRHPFLDRRVIEFAVSLPQEQLRRGPETKYILRRSMRNLLPERIRTRISKAFYCHPFERAIRAFGRQGFYNSLNLGQNGWIDSRKVGEMLENLISQPTADAAHSTGNLVPLWMVCSTELWFRNCIAKDPRLFTTSLFN